MVNYWDNNASFSQSSNSPLGSSLSFGQISKLSSNNFPPTTTGGGIDPFTSSTGGSIFGGNSVGACGSSSLQTSSTSTLGATSSPIIGSLFSSHASSSGFGSSFPALSVPFSSTIPSSVCSISGSFPVSSLCQSAPNFSASTLPGSTSFGVQSTATQSTKNSVENAFGCQCQQSQVGCYTVTLEKDETSITGFPSALISISAMPVYKDKSHEELRLEYHRGLCSKPVGTWNQFTSQKPTFSNRGTQGCSTNLPSSSSKLGESRTGRFIASSRGGFGSKLGESRTSGFIASSGGGTELEKINSISSIPIYSAKSHEELRLEDYKSGGCKPVNQFAGRLGACSSTTWETPFSSLSAPSYSFVNPFWLSTHSNLLTPQRQDSCPSETSFFRFPDTAASASTSNFISSRVPSFTVPFSTGSTVSQNSFPFFSPSSPSVPRPQLLSFPPTGASTSESSFSNSRVTSSDNSVSTVSSSLCPNSFSFSSPSSPSVPQLLPYSFPDTAASASTSNLFNSGVPSSATPFSVGSSTVCQNSFSFFSPPSPFVPQSQLFSFPPIGVSISESNFTNSGVMSSANPISTMSSSVCPNLFSFFSPSSPSVPHTLPFSFPVTATPAPASNFTGVPSANLFSTLSSTVCPNSFSFFSPSSQSVPQTQPFSFPGIAASTSISNFPDSGFPSSAIPFSTVSSTVFPNTFSILCPSPNIQPFSFPDTRESMSASNITSPRVPSSAKPFPPFQYSIPWKSTYCEPAGPFTQPNISGEALTKGGFFNLSPSTQSCANNSAKFSQKKTPFVASPPTLTADFGDAASTGIFNQSSAGLNDSRVANQSGGQTINGQESISADAEVDLSSTISSPFSVHIQYENSSIHVSGNAANESSRLGSPSIQVCDINPMLRGHVCVTITRHREGEFSVVVGKNHDITKIMPKIQSAEYYTIPPIEELATRERAEPGFCGHVKDFVVGRQGYGSIKFFGESDVRELDLEALIKFTNRGVIVFTDVSKKPPTGQGLNKAAEITLLNVKCINKYTGIPYTDGPPVEAYRQLLKDKVAELQGEMVSYDPALGEWKFRVKHF